LRDSGVIGEDADVVCFMYCAAFLERHAGWENCLKEVPNIVEVIIAKQRMGLISIERLSFNPELTQFTDL
jgi:replicative DNA helicase